jgi:hypothetical protein
MGVSCSSFPRSGVGTGTYRLHMDRFAEERRPGSLAYCLGQ